MLDTILEPKKILELYDDIYHKVRINYYPPRGDDKEGWDNIDIFGWLGYPMQIKSRFFYAEIASSQHPLFLTLFFLDLAKKAKMDGIQEWLSFYFKSPMCLPELYPEHDLFVQLAKLKNTFAPYDGRRSYHSFGSRLLRDTINLKLIIIAAGQGSRLRAKTDKPKTLTKIHGTPIIDTLLNNCKKKQNQRNTYNYGLQQ